MNQTDRTIKQAAKLFGVFFLGIVVEMVGLWGEMMTDSCGFCSSGIHDFFGGMAAVGLGTAALVLLYGAIRFVITGRYPL